MADTPTIPPYRCGRPRSGGSEPLASRPEEGPREGRPRPLRPDPAPPTAHRCG